MTRKIDSRGARTGAAVSVLLLASAALLRANGITAAAALIVAAVALAMAVSAVTALRHNALSVPFLLLRHRGVIGDPRPEDLQPAAGIRLAQALGAIFLAFALLAGALSADLVAIVLIAALASLQTLLALTGICVACRFYGVVVWLEHRNQPLDATPIVAQKINIQR